MDLNVELILSEIYNYVRQSKRCVSYMEYYTQAFFVGDECDACYNDINPCNNGEQCNFIKSWQLHISDLSKYNTGKLTDFLNGDLADYDGLKSKLEKIAKLKSFC